MCCLTKICRGCSSNMAFQNSRHHISPKCMVTLGNSKVLYETVNNLLVTGIKYKLIAGVWSQEPIPYVMTWGVRFLR
jgi:hypothetical protein